MGPSLLGPTSSFPIFFLLHFCVVGSTTSSTKSFRL
jgi:hypothetical protein